MNQKLANTDPINKFSYCHELFEYFENSGNLNYQLEMEFKFSFGTGILITTG